MKFKFDEWTPVYSKWHNCHGLVIKQTENSNGEPAYIVVFNDKRAELVREIFLEESGCDKLNETLFYLEWDGELATILVDSLIEYWKGLC